MKRLPCGCIGPMICIFCATGASVPCNHPHPSMGCIICCEAARVLYMSVLLGRPRWA